MSDVNDLLSATQVAALLGISRQRVVAIAKGGEMGRKVGATYVFTLAEVEAYRARKKQPHGVHPKESAGTLPAASPA